MVPLLLVGDFKTMTKLLIHPGSQGRFVPNGPFYKIIHDLRLQKPGRISGVVLSQGEIWKDHKIFMVKTLNTLGLRGSSLENMVMEEVGKSFDCLGEKAGQPVQVVGLFQLSVINILWKMTAGENVNNNYTKLREFCDGLHAAAGFLAAIFSIIFPWIFKVFPNLTELKVHKEFYSFISQEIQDLIETHKDDLDVDNPKDLIDHFLIEIENNNEELPFLDVED